MQGRCRGDVGEMARGACDDGHRNLTLALPLPLSLNLSLSLSLSPTLAVARISGACDEGHGIHKANALAVLDAVAPLVLAQAGVGGPTAQRLLLR